MSSGSTDPCHPAHGASQEFSDLAVGQVWQLTFLLLLHLQISKPCGPMTWLCGPWAQSGVEPDLARLAKARA